MTALPWIILIAGVALVGAVFIRRRARAKVILADTSVLIDGRIADVAAAGFLGGTLLIPGFVLRELQQVADSPDAGRRARGRRGLDVVLRLQQEGHAKPVDDDVVAVKEVDMKLVSLAERRGCRLMTNDFNLNKVAQARGVRVLNMNELAGALRPVVLPGETLRVLIVKEGTEASQGVAYLEDGTMVVVENARKQVSRTVEVTVTSVLQTHAGRMIFGRYDEALPLRDVKRG